MDPNANGAETIRLAHDILNDPDADTDAARLAELVEALDGWISKGGYLPSAFTYGGGAR